MLLDGRAWGGDKSASGHWVGPTILLHSNKADRAMHDEIFGPVLSIYQVATKEEAIAIENANPYALKGGIFSN